MNLKRKASSLTENATQKTSTPPENVFQSTAFKDFLLYLLKGISVFAHRCRTAKLTNPAIDRFTAQSLSVITGENPVNMDEYQTMVVEALKVRRIAADLYESACAHNRIEREDLPGPATMEFFTEKETLAAQARGLSAKKLSRDQKDFYWESVCVDRLGTIGTIIAAEPDSVTREYDVSGFLHKALDYLSKNLSGLELVAMADQLEKARLKIVNALLTGDTLVDIPAPRITLSDIKNPPSN